MNPSDSDGGLGGENPGAGAMSVFAQVQGTLTASRDFVRLWAANTVSGFGSLVTRTALPFAAVLMLNATPFQMALLSAADLVAGLLVGLIAGVWVDRMRRRPVMIATDLGRAVLLVTIPVAAALGVLRIEQLYAVEFLAGAMTMVFVVAYQAYERGPYLT